MREHPPTAAAAGEIEDGVDDLAQGIRAGPPGAAVAAREQVLDVIPLQVGQVAGIALAGECGAHNERVTAWPVTAKDRFLDGL